MPFGGSCDEETSQAIFNKALDAGVNVFDTANVYTGGRSEEILGRLVKGLREEVVLVTKAYFPTADKPNARGSTRYHLMRAVEDSLRRLQTDRIDVLYLHRFDDVTDLEETLRVLEDLVRSGKVLYLGASNFAAWQVAKSLGISARNGWNAFVAIQPMYNLVKRQAEVELLPMAHSESLAVFPYSPLGAGLLTGKYGVGRQPDEGRLVENPQYQKRYGEQNYFQIAEDFTALARELDVHPVSLAIAWVGGHQAVTAPIIGARNVEQLGPALESVTIDMTPELRDRIAGLSFEPAPATDRNEEGTSVSYGAR